MTLNVNPHRAVRTGAGSSTSAWSVVSSAMLVASTATLLCAGAASASCWDEAGARFGVHPWLLAAIARVESGFNPRAVNDTHAARTGSVDLGLMQINSTWLPVLARHGITRERLFDPCTSITVGAWILAELFGRYGVTWEAVGAYNAACVRLDRAACTARRAAYARKVQAALELLSGGLPIVLASTAVERILRVTIEEPRAPDARTPDLPGKDLE